MARSGKAFYRGLVLIFLTWCLCGCTDAVELTDKDNELVAEYLSNLLLRYEDGFGDGLHYPKAGVQDAEDVSQSEPPTVTEEPSPEADVQTSPYQGVENHLPVGQLPSEEPVAAGQPGDDQQNVGESAEEEPVPKLPVGLSEIFKDFGIRVKYSGHNAHVRYREGNDAYVVLPHDRKNMLVVVDFRVTNAKKGRNKVNLGKYDVSNPFSTGGESSGDGITYVLRSAQGSQYEAEVSLLNNGGLNRLRVSLPRKGSAKASLIFEVPKDFVMEGTTLEVKRGEDTANVPL